jgi:hypothetical protein
MSRENAAFVTASGNAGITFETQGRCENEGCPDYGREFAPGEWLEPVDGQSDLKDRGCRGQRAELVMSVRWLPTHVVVCQMELQLELVA